MFPHLQDSGSQFPSWAPVLALHVPLSFPLASSWAGMSCFSLRPSGGLSQFLRDTPTRPFCFPVVSDYGHLFPPSIPSFSLCLCGQDFPVFLFLTLVSSSGLPSLLGQVLPPCISVHLLPLPQKLPFPGCLTPAVEEWQASSSQAHGLDLQWPAPMSCFAPGWGGISTGSICSVSGC